MKKIILSLMMATAFSAANAITLFPHFVDVAGDFRDGTTDIFVELNRPTLCWQESPHFFKTLKDADSFLMDTLPFSSYVINKETEKLEDGTEIITYISSLEADGINVGKWSRLYLIQKPDGTFYVGLAEDQ